MIQGLETTGIVECLFEPVEIQTVRTIASGESLNLTVGAPFWRASIRIETPTRQAKAIWRAWATGRRGSRNPFLLSRSFSIIPRAGAVSDTGLGVSGVNFGASTVTLTGAGTHPVRTGDMISYYTAAGGYYIGEAIAAATPSSGNVTIAIWPPPAAPHASTPRPRRMYAFGEFFLDGPVNRTETHEPDSLEFEARQLIRPAGGAVSPFSPPIASGTNAVITESLVF